MTSSVPADPDLSYRCGECRSASVCDEQRKCVGSSVPAGARGVDREATAAPQSRAREELSCRMCGTPVTYRMLRRPLWLWWLLFRKRSS